MKKLIFSFTLVCFSLFGKKGIVDAYNNIPTKPQNAASSVVSLVSDVPIVSDVANIPALIPAVPGLDVATGLLSSLTDSVSTVTNLVNLSTVTNVIPKTGNLNLIPLPGILPSIDTLPIQDVTAVPNIVENSPVLVVTNAIPAELSTVENVITSVLNSKKAHSKIACYKGTVGNATLYIFAPCAACKNPITNAYETIVDLVTTIVSKLQELLAQNNPQATAVAYEASEPTILQDKV